MVVELFWIVWTLGRISISWGSYVGKKLPDRNAFANWSFCEPLVLYFGSKVWWWSQFGIAVEKSKRRSIVSSFLLYLQSQAFLIRFCWKSLKAVCLISFQKRKFMSSPWSTDVSKKSDRSFFIFFSGNSNRKPSSEFLVRSFYLCFQIVTDRKCQKCCQILHLGFRYQIFP